MADLYALAIQTDRTRFGSLTSWPPGSGNRMTGDYRTVTARSGKNDEAPQQNAGATRAAATNGGTSSTRNERTRP
ncbi:MAG: hypothetical protein CM1200mP2_38620 [Planctomycetaceae bacterium]|nr:MAG: hypothetical protein CM1200mP2_38620 [Planctomycetaceae bacterium]